MSNEGQIFDLMSLSRWQPWCNFM